MKPSSGSRSAVPSRVTIRPYEPGDAAALYEAVRESIGEVYPWLQWCHPGYARREAEAWIEHCRAARERGDEYQFAIVDEWGRYLGGCGLNKLQHDHRVANLGYWVRSSAAGRGVASAAVRQLAAFAFRETDLHRLEIIAAVGNRASQRVAERAGATREAEIRGRLHLHGAAHDAVQYSIVRGGWDPSASPPASG